MNAQETIDTIDNLIKHIANSDNERIERDLFDDPFEPVNIDILGNMYSYVRAEVVGQHDYYAGCDIEEKCDIAIYLQRMDDFGTCDIAEEYKFIASIEWIKEWMQELDEYLHYDETHHYMDEFINSGYPLCSSYAKKAKELEEGTLEESVYASIAMALYHTQDNVEQTIRNFTPDQQYPEYIEVQKRAIALLTKEQEHEN